MRMVRLPVMMVMVPVRSDGLWRGVRPVVMAVLVGLVLVRLMGSFVRLAVVVARVRAVIVGRVGRVALHAWQFYHNAEGFTPCLARRTRAPSAHLYDGNGYLRVTHPNEGLP